MQIKELGFDEWFDILSCINSKISQNKKAISFYRGEGLEDMLSPLTKQNEKLDGLAELAREKLKEVS